jgi:hypothetical protein
MLDRDRTKSRTDKEQRMRFYIFKSETTKDLRAFAGDQSGSRLPGNHAPWTVTGVVPAKATPPHNLPRETIEEAIETEGFQLWRLKTADGK